MHEPDWEGQFDAFVRQKLALYQTPGMAVAFAQGGELRHARGYGLREVASGDPVTPDTLFGIGSATKSFTCLAVMQLAEAGKLALNDPVVKHLEEFRMQALGDWPPPTIHHLMTHTSGLPPTPALAQALMRSSAGDPAVDPGDLPPGAEPIDSVDGLLEHIAKSPIPPLGAPGQHFSYSNDGYALLGAIIERVSGMAYEDYVEEHILRPCAMERTTFLDPVAQGLPEVTQLYAVKRGEHGEEEVYPAPGWWQATPMTSAGFLRSTVTDLLHYLEAYLQGGRAPGGRVLSEAGIARMLEPQVAMTPGQYYGYGWMVWPDFHGHRLVEHGGSLKGIAAALGMVPDAGLAGAALANLQGGPSGHVLLAGLGHALGRPLAVYRRAFPDQGHPVTNLPDYVGEYRSGENDRFLVAQSGEDLSCELLGQTFALQPVGRDAFTLQRRDDEIFLRFLRRADGEVYAASFHYRVVYRAESA